MDAEPEPAADDGGSYGCVLMGLLAVYVVVYMIVLMAMRSAGA